MKIRSSSLLVLIVALVAMGISGCDCGSGGPVIVVSVILVNPDPGAFGDVPEGGTSVIVFTITNNSTATINLTNIALQTGTDFAITAGAVPPAVPVLAAGTYNVDVTFSPTAVQAYNDTLIIDHDGAGGQVTVALTGAGVQPDIQADSISVTGAAFNTSDPLPIDRTFSEAAGVAVITAFDVEYVLSTDTVWDPADTSIATEPVVSMTASEIVSGALAPVPTTPGVPTGSYYIGMTVDINNTVTETNEANNVVWTANPVTVTLTQIIIDGNVQDGAGAPIANARVYAGPDFSDTDAAGDYSIVVPTTGPFDVTCYAPGYIGETRASITAPSTENFVLAAPTNVLLYTDTGLNPANSAETALADLGMTPTALYDQNDAAFNTELTSGTVWDLVVVDKPQWGMNTGGYGFLDTWITSTPTARVVFDNWWIHNDPTNPLFATMGVTIVSGAGTEPIYRWDTTHPISNFPEQWPDANPAWPATGFGTNSHHISLNGGIAVAGYTATSTPGMEKLVIHNGGRTVFLAFLPEIAHTGAWGAPGTTIDYDTDGKGDANEMWRNFFTYVLGH